jgi:hypothetical protein
MGEKDTVVKEKFKYGGLGDFKETYKFARDWFWKEDFNLIEDSYTEKIVGNGKEIEIEWTATKKITDYFKVILKAKWRILGMTDVEVELDGKKKKMNKFAELGMELKGVLEKDYSNKWGVSGYEKFFKDIYQKYVIPERTDKKEDEVRDFIQDFKEEMKAFLELTGRR